MPPVKAATSGASSGQTQPLFRGGIVWGLVQWDIWWPFSNKPFEADGPKLAERCEEMVEDLAWTGTPFDLTGASHGSQEGPGVVFYVRRKPSS